MQTGEVPQHYCIVANDDQVQSAQKLLETRYQVITRLQAMNGSREHMRGASVLCWPPEDNQGLTDMRLFAGQLADSDEHPEVKFLDIDDKWQPSDFVARERTFEDFKNLVYATKRLELVKAYKGGSASAGTARERTDTRSHTPEPPPINAAPPEQSLGGTPLPDDLAVSDGAAPDMPDTLPIEVYADEVSRETSVEIPEYREMPHSYGLDTEPPEPLDLTKSLYRGKPLPLNLLPDALRAFVGDCTRRTGIDSGAFLIGALGAISGLCSDTVKLQPKQLDTRWRVHPTINPIAVGASSSGKTPGVEEAMYFLKELDAEEEITNIKLRLDHKYAMDKYEMERKASLKSGGTGTRPKEPELPKLRQLWVDKATPEGVENVLTTSPKIVWYMDEVSALINGIDRYAASGKGSGGREFVLRLYNGGRGKKTLSGGNSDVSLSAPIVGGITPSAMLNMAGGKLEADGLLQRTFLCMVRGMKHGVDAKPNPVVYEQFDRLLRNLMQQAGEVTLTLDKEGQGIYNEFCAKLLLLMKHEENEALSAHMGKWLGMAPRLMLIYYMAELAQNGQQPVDGEEIPSAIVSNVCRLFMDWQLSHVQEFWNELMSDKTSRRFAQTIARYILANDEIEVLNFRDHIAKSHHRALGKLKPWEIAEGINTLINGAWLTPRGSKLNSYRVALEFDVNPRIRNMFEQQREEEREMRAIKREELQQMRSVDDELPVD